MIAHCDLRTRRLKHVRQALEEIYGSVHELVLFKITHEEDQVIVQGELLVKRGQHETPFVIAMSGMEAPLDFFSWSPNATEWQASLCSTSDNKASTDTSLSTIVSLLVCVRTTLNQLINSSNSDAPLEGRALSKDQTNCSEIQLSGISIGRNDEDGKKAHP